jgi:sterol desaturase/sphingolipid hydroxylase (fatty acid hydroxylase superfamily)
MLAIILCGMLLTPLIDFGLYLLSTFIMQRSISISVIHKALSDWHGNLLNYILTWYLLFNRFTWLIAWSDILMFVVYFFIVDAVFYIVHRICHKLLYYPYHQVHHICRPFNSHCARNSHWIDATLENISFFTPFFVLQYNAPCAFVCLFGNVIWASYVHSYPTYISKDTWLVTPYIHWIHHQYSSEASYNYALYFTIWDRLLGTYTEKSKIMIDK